jgi:hypothetical protein
MKKMISVLASLFFILGASPAHAGPAWGPPGWPNGAPDPSPPPKAKCYKTERYCTEWLKDGHCKLWDTRKVEVPC